MDFLFADKPAGVTTHTSLHESERAKIQVDPNDGFKECLEARFESPLHVAHRLDRGTTGAIVFALSTEAAETLRELFATHQVQKTYLFLSDKPCAQDTFEAESFIERQGADYVSRPATAETPANSFTHFRRLEQSHGLTLWEAKPRSGKPHQIRLHAEACGISVLGDDEHGGSPYPALCLHSHSIEFEVSGERHHHVSPPPRWFARRALTEDPFVARWLMGIDRRERLIRSWKAFGEAHPETLRWLHTESDPLRAEQLGDVHSLSWFGEGMPSPAERESLDTLISELGWGRWYLQLRGNRGRSPLEETQIRGAMDFPARWAATENGLRFEFRTDTGLSPGLFLDQRRNRRWVLANSANKSVLNLFCYTGGFSVAAARGGASKVVSVDVSKPFLEWSKANFTLNGLSTEGHEFRAIDTREYLAWAKKKGFLFDLIICDPPSFGRSKAGVFRIEKDLDGLIEQLLDVLSPKGRVLFSINYEAWDEAGLCERLDRALKKSKRHSKARLARTPSADWDFELPGEPKNMKSVFLENF
jgi:23S rRNA (cytosine1962-C5)-methyltransferase